MWEFLASDEAQGEYEVRYGSSPGEGFGVQEYIFFTDPNTALMVKLRFG